MGWGAGNPPGGPLSIVQASRGINDMQDELDERHELSTRVQELESTEGQIIALEGKGYAVVKLPAPLCEADGDGRVEFSDGFSAAGTLVVEIRSGLVWSSGSSGQWEFGCEQARAVAASWLAAANAAEQVQQ